MPQDSLPKSVKGETSNSMKTLEKPTDIFRAADYHTPLFDSSLKHLDLLHASTPTAACTSPEVGVEPPAKSEPLKLKRRQQNSRTPAKSEPLKVKRRQQNSHVSHSKAQPPIVVSSQEVDDEKAAVLERTHDMAKVSFCVVLVCV